MNPNMLSLIYDSFTTLSKSSYDDIQKHIEKVIIQHMLIPKYQNEVQQLITSYQQKMHQSATETHQQVQALHDLVSTVIEGQWSNKVRETIAHHQQGYDKI